MPNNLLETIGRVSVHELTNKGSATLILHTRLHQINRIYRSSTNGFKQEKFNINRKKHERAPFEKKGKTKFTSGEGSEGKAVSTLQDLATKATVNRCLIKLEEIKN